MVTHETATLFFALLALGLAVGLLVVVAGLLFDRSDRLAIRRSVGPLGVEAAAVVAVTCTAGSLYLSEVANFLPCRLCWVQRGFMYPAAVLLVLAAATRARWPALVAAALSAPGLIVAGFHRYEQSAGEVGGFCDLSNPCSGRWVNHFGFVTIPTMAAIGFAGILILVSLQLRWRQS